MKKKKEKMHWELQQQARELALDALREGMEALSPRFPKESKKSKVENTCLGFKEPILPLVS